MSVSRSATRDHAAWLSLIETSGPFLSLSVLSNTADLRQGVPSVDPGIRRELSGYYEQWRANAGRRKPDPALDLAWFRAVTQDVLGWTDDVLLEGQAIPAGLDVWVGEHGETLRPDLVLRDPEGFEKREVRLLIQRYPSNQGLDKPLTGARWQESPANRMIELLHRTNIRLGLVTNGEQWMLVNAPVGEPTGLASWYAGLWFEERTTLDAFRAILGAARFFGVMDDATLEQMLIDSAEDQTDVTVRLGDQVRQAIELLVAGIDEADRDSVGELLADVDDATVYEAAITVMMRLVFLLFAEDQRPPLFGDANAIYEHNYSVAGLIDQMEEVDGEEILEHRRDAWPRLLATFRLVHAGSDHPDMRQPAYGGSLFDPDRFPFLEGRLPGTAWTEMPAAPLPLSNRTVLHMLQAIQFLEIGGARQRLSFRALDVEQIGHVYEQLLEHTARRADDVVLGLNGTSKKQPEVSLTDLENWRNAGEDELVKRLRELTGRTAAPLKRALNAELDLFLEGKLRTACVTRETFDRVRPYAGLIRIGRAGQPMVIQLGSLFVTQGDDRRTTGAHYTPRVLTESIVRHTLEPLIYDGPADGKPREDWVPPTPGRILDLRVCDPAMGSGAFLVQACRYLAGHLVEAWDRIQFPDRTARESGPVMESTAPKQDLYIAPSGTLSAGGPEERLLPTDPDERLALARRLVADHCLYGVDVNPLAVDMAKLSLWLVTLQKDRPFTFLDHRLRCGDSLLGIGDIDQLRRFSLEPPKPGERAIHSQKIDRYLQYAIEGRRRIEAMPADDAVQIAEKARALEDIEQVMEGIRLGADLLIGAALTDRRSRAGRREQAYRDFTLITQLLPDAAGREFRTDHVAASLADYAATADRWLEGNRPFHWPLEFPEVFIVAADHTAPTGFSAIIGNPPFLGGKKITGAFGIDYRNYLIDALAGGTRGNADLCAYFFLRCGQVLKRNGGLGMLATNTIAQGDTREVGLDRLVAEGFTIPRAVPSRPWPGTAALEVAHLWLRRGDWSGDHTLDDEPAKGITPYLTIPGRAVGNPYRLAANAGRSFIGSYVLGMGFVLEPEEALAMIDRDPRNRDVLFPYLNGEDLNSRPDQSPSRWVINFHDWPLERAMEYPEPFKILEEKVKADRLSKAKDVAAAPWWQFWRPRPALYSTIAGLDRVLVRAQVSKTHAMVFFEPGIVFSMMVIPIALERWSDFAILQSNLHERWTNEYASSLKGDQRYTPTDCFETFPMPDSETSRNLVLEQVGEEYYETRREILSDRGIALTHLYNLFNDSSESAVDIQNLRTTHIDLDNAVAAAYGWDDLDLEHGFHETPQGMRFTISERARREVLDRLLLLNHERYAAEVEQGLHEKGAKRKTAKARQKVLL